MQMKICEFITLLHCWFYSHSEATVCGHEIPNNNNNNNHNNNNNNNNNNNTD